MMRITIEDTRRWALKMWKSRITSRLARRTLGTMWGRQRPSMSMTLSSLSAIRDTWRKQEDCARLLLVSLHVQGGCLIEMTVLLTSAPRRLSEHILQKDSKACWKAGDNFLEKTTANAMTVGSVSFTLNSDLEIVLTTKWQRSGLTLLPENLITALFVILVIKVKNRR